MHIRIALKSFNHFPKSIQSCNNILGLYHLYNLFFQPQFPLFLLIVIIHFNPLKNFLPLGIPHFPILPYLPKFHDAVYTVTPYLCPIQLP